MDHVSAGDATRLGARNRRWRMREQARVHHAAPARASDRYQTPEWLERSFVLPLTQPEASDVPTQPVRRHDDDPERAQEPRVMPSLETGAALDTPAPPAASFVRPPSEDIDFALVVRRHDLSRRVTRVHWFATGLAAMSLLVFLLAASPVALVAVVACALVALGAFVVRMRLHRAPVPRLQR